jgi:hypothetical protein
MQVRPWGPSITPQAHHFKGDSDVEAKSKYDSLFQNLHYKPTLRLQLSLILRLQKDSRLQMEEIVLLFIQWDE